VRTRTRVAGTLAAVVVGLLPGAASAGPEEGPAIELLLGDGNVGAALGWSGLFDAGSAPEVLLARDDGFADALASGTAQAGGRPLLLNPTDALDDRVAQELERLGATTIHILGGEAAISPEVVDELEGLGYDVIRYAGQTRVDTAVAIADAFAPGADTAIIARAFPSAGGDPTQAFADSLAAGAWAADAAIPIFLTETDQLSGPTGDAIGDFAQLFVVGGTGAVSEGVFQQLQDAIAPDGTVVRVAGDNRFSTSIEINDARGLDPNQVAVIDGLAPQAWAAGFPAAAYAGLADAPIVLGAGTALSPEMSEWLGRWDDIDRAVCDSLWVDLCGQVADRLAIPFSLVDVEVLVFGGRRYPVEQFEVEPAHSPNCEVEHWHARRGTVYPLEARAQALVDPGGCGFGATADNQPTMATVSANQHAMYEARAN
jgi:putative cell wall-binding protein